MRARDFLPEDRYEDAYRQQWQQFQPDGEEQRAGMVLRWQQVRPNRILVQARSGDGSRELGSVQFHRYDPTSPKWTGEALHVDERYRRQGVATAMYDWFKKKFGPIRPSDAQTRDGESFWQRKKVWEQGVAEGLNEYRDQLWAWIQSKFPSTQWPEYVQRDFLYAKAKGNQNRKDLEDFSDEIQRDFGRVRWRLEKLPITLDIFTPKTQRMIKEREGGSSNPYQVPKDAERHALQQKMIQHTGVSSEPIIVAKLSNGYDLIEGWHRTIQHLKAYPEGYTAPAWVGYGATYTSESMAENFADGKVKGRSRPGRFKRAGVSCKGSVADLRRKAKNSSGERQKGFHWCANMKSGKKKAAE